MFLLIYLAILISMYIAQNTKIGESTKTIWFVGLAIILALNFVLSLL